MAGVPTIDTVSTDDRASSNLVRNAFYANRLLSQAGQGVFMAGLFLLAGTGQSSATGLSGVFVAMMAAAILCGLPAGAIIDRLGPARSLLVGATGRGLLMALLLVLPDHPLTFALVAFGYSAASQVFSPAELALIPAISAKRPAGAHAMLVALQYAGQVVGVALLAPIALWLAGPSTMVVMGIAIYTLALGTSAILASQLAWVSRISTARESFSFSGPLRYFVGKPAAGYAGLLLAFGELTSKSLIVAVPAYLSEDLGLAGGHQVAVVAMGVLGCAGALAWAGRSLHVRHAGPVLWLSLLGSVAAVVLLASLSQVVSGAGELNEWTLDSRMGDSRLFATVIMTPVGLLLGICFTITPIAGRAILSATAPDSQQGRVFAMQAMFSDLVCMVPLGLSGVSVELAGARSTLMLIGALGLCLVFVLKLTALGHSRHSHAERLPA